MARVEETLRHYDDREVSSRADRPLGLEREARLAEFLSFCARLGLSSVGSSATAVSSRSGVARGHVA